MSLRMWRRPDSRSSAAKRSIPRSATAAARPIVASRRGCGTNSPGRPASPRRWRPPRDAPHESRPRHAGSGLTCGRERRQMPTTDQGSPGPRGRLDLPRPARSSGRQGRAQRRSLDAGRPQDRAGPSVSKTWTTPCSIRRTWRRCAQSRQAFEIQRADRASAGNAAGSTGHPRGAAPCGARIDGEEPDAAHAALARWNRPFDAVGPRRRHEGSDRRRSSHRRRRSARSKGQHCARMVSASSSSSSGGRERHLVHEVGMGDDGARSVVEAIGPTR